MTFSRILHPVEYSDEGRQAVAQAFALASSYQTDLHFVRVRSRRDPTERESTERARLREFVSQSYPNQATFELAILYGDPVLAVAEYAQSTAPDLVLVGKTGRRGSSLWRTGVYARELASAIRCPTLVAHTGQNRTSADTQPMFRNILCPVDSSPPAVAALKQAVVLAKPGSRLTALHVLDGFPQEAVPSASGAFAFLEELLDDLDSSDAQTLIVSGVPHEAILSTATEVKPDLIVIGLPIRGRFDAVFMRSTGASVVRRANCAVLMVPDPTNTIELTPTTPTLPQWSEA
jgi:nucleotide-binding universal stress UspA family protein